MNLHEYQAKEILRRFQIPVPAGEAADSVSKAGEAAARLGGDRFVVKAQIHAGGRGKAGGVLLVNGRKGVEEAAQKILGRRLVTPQTGPSGQPVDQVLVQVQTDLSKELYAAVVLDRSKARPSLIFSASGGMEIEEMARKKPGAVWKLPFSPRQALNSEETGKFLSQGSLPPDDVKKLAPLLSRLTQIFLETDASLVEINPLAQTPAGDFLAIDAKIRLDDNGLEKHPELARLRDPRQEDPREVEAKKFDLSYVGLEGNIGCMVNGAGLAMATMDLIKLAGGEPANFLDVGGGATKEKVAAAFKIILADPKVKAILVNIFGGIMRCDTLAEGILAAVQESGLKIPLVVRLEGTKVEEGKAILKKSGLRITSAETLEEAARKAVEYVHSH